MSTATDTSATGKSTRGSGPLSVGEATRTLALPQAPYADAVHAALDAVGMVPAVLEVGLRDTRPRTPELFLRLVWPAGHAALAEAVTGAGLTLAWSHVTGWSAHNADDEAELLDVDPLAAPQVIAAAAEVLTAQALTRWSPPDDAPTRWAEAVYLDLALVRFEERDTPWC
ncbi:hypothetical protein ACF08A_25795 [Streptomyces cellulosae]